MTTTVVIETARTKPKTAGQIIFDKMFSVRMSVVDAMDENDVHSRGMFTTGYADIDAQAAKRPTVVWRTIAEMVELWHDGVAMELVNGMVDAEKINKIIQEHLADCTRWHQSQQYGLRREDPSVTQQRLEDLRKMDEFARQIYNKSVNTAKTITSLDWLRLSRVLHPRLVSILSVKKRWFLNAVRRITSLSKNVLITTSSRNVRGTVHEYPITSPANHDIGGEWRQPSLPTPGNLYGTRRSVPRKGCYRETNPIGVR